VQHVGVKYVVTNICPCDKKTAVYTYVNGDVQ